jgi:hypothetical protein
VVNWSGDSGEECIIGVCTSTLRSVETHHVAITRGIRSSGPFSGGGFFPAAPRGGKCARRKAHYNLLGRTSLWERQTDIFRGHTVQLSTIIYDSSGEHLRDNDDGMRRGAWYMVRILTASGRNNLDPTPANNLVERIESKGLAGVRLVRGVGNASDGVVRLRTAKSLARV